jgi:hypothetical protein
MGCWRAQPELLIWNLSNLGDLASPKTAKTIKDGIVDDTAHCVVPWGVVLLPNCTKFSLPSNNVELEILGVVDQSWTSEVLFLIGVVGETRICCNEGADVIVGAGIDAVNGFLVVLIALLHQQNVIMSKHLHKSPRHSGSPCLCF